MFYIWQTTKMHVHIAYWTYELASFELDAQRLYIIMLEKQFLQYVGYT